MTPKQIEQSLQTILQDIATIKARQKTDHDRIEENKFLATQIHKLAANLEHLTHQLKGQNERVDRLVDSFEDQLKTQGLRIGKLETTMQTQTIISEKLLEQMDKLETDTEDLKMKGSRRWDGIVEKGLCVVIGAILMYFLYRFGM